VVRVGQVLSPFGVDGAVKVISLTDFPDRFAPGSELVLDGCSHHVEWSRQQRAGLIVKLCDLDTRTAAEAHRGRYLEVPDSHLRRLPEGRWYHHQLVGLGVKTEDGRALGTLTEVMSLPANDVWVAKDGVVDRLIPATRDAVLEVDLEAGRVTVADWLLEVEDA
jgi:16S rRNA processing protein RimM